MASVIAYPILQIIFILVDFSMSLKKIYKKKIIDFKNFNFSVPKNFDLNKLKINPANIIEDTKSKVGNYYINLKKEWEKQKIKVKKKMNQIKKKNYKNKKYKHRKKD